MTIDKQKLKALAEAATQGVWTHERFGVIQAGPVIQFANGAGRQQIAMATGADWMVQGEQIANAEFMAAANPSVVLALLAEIDRLESETVHTAAGVQSDREQRDQLKAENEALRYDIKVANSVVLAEKKDAERYRWLREKDWIQVEVDVRCGESETLPEMDAVIDAAMAKEVSHG